MAELFIKQFTGMIPRRADPLLPEVTASVARNARLTSGTLRALREPVAIANVSQSGNVWRLRFNDASTYILTSNSQNVDVVQSPLLNDKYDRFYKFGENGPNGYPLYNTAERIKNGEPWLELGVPQPRRAPIVTASATTEEDVLETRVYTYTLASTFGEESAPAEPFSVDGAIDGAYTITIKPEAFPITEMQTRSIDTIHIYRTVTGFSSATFFRVATIKFDINSVLAGNDITHVDTTSSYDASQGYILESTTWTMPPKDLEGAVVMPNGFLVAWRGKDIYMSEAYRPHAWPDEYAQALEYDIVGLGVFGQSVVACTNSAPYIGTGVSPQALTFYKAASVEPCLSRKSIVSSLFGVMYASPNGLVLVNGPTLQLVTKQLLSKYEWQEIYNPNNITAAAFNNQYLAFYTPTKGFIFDPSEPTSAFVEVSSDFPVTRLTTDVHTGEVLMLSPTTLYTWDKEGAPLRTYIWRSKEYVSPVPINLSAMRIEFEGDDSEVGTPDPAELSYNATRINRRMNAVGLHPVAGVYKDIINSNIPENKLPLAGSQIRPIRADAPDPTVTIRVYAQRGNIMYEVITLTTATSDRILRMPTGFKSTRWMIELEGQRPVQAVKCSTTVRGLRNV